MEDHGTRRKIIRPWISLPKKQAAGRLSRIGTEAGIVRRASVHRLMAWINGLKK
jgi:hypothetical protein